MIPSDLALVPGTRLGPYEVVAQIGVGGMGEVYRATDTTLGRQVAIKVLPDAFSADPERLARFEREAKTLASLNHPNIAAIYGFEKAAGAYALVMELVEGPTLADLISGESRGLPAAQALPIARQLAEALEAAHQQGIVHRDLKPANIKVRSDGTVKVLDFGLAKAMEPAGTMAASNSMAPTITTPAMTQTGTILGTAAYMSPEQARGKTVDRRADIWAFGCVLFEMLTGQRAFTGDDVSDVLASVLAREPEWSRLPLELSPTLISYLRRCLQKDPRQRIHDIADVRLALDGAFETPPSPRSDSGVAVRQPSRSSVAVPWAMASVLGLGLVLVLARWAPWKSAPALAPVRLSAELGADVSLVSAQESAEQGTAAVLSPDGTLLAFTGRANDGSPRLYVRRLAQLQATALTGTDGARSPFFSPDGQWLGFFADGKLKKVSVSGGAAVTLCEAAGTRGGSWSEDGTIVFAPGNRGVGLMRVSSAGGTTEPLTTLANGETTQRWPQLLPGGRAVLYTSQGGAVGSGFEDASLVVQPLPSGPRTVVQQGGYQGRYARSGHITYVHDGTLFAVPFDVDRLAVTGPSAPALEGLGARSATGAADFALADTGTLIFLPGQGRGGSAAPIFWMGREGKTTPLRAMPVDWSQPGFSPDGQRIAVDLVGVVGGSEDVWVYDWARDTLSRLTFDSASDQAPTWTPDGRRIAFKSRRGAGPFNVFWQRADGTGEAQRLTESTNAQHTGSWHPSGRSLAFAEDVPQRGADLMILPLSGDEASGWTPGKPTAFLSTRFNERHPQFSSDGRWLAYDSDESGQDEVYVRPFPGPGGKWQVSTGGGRQPQWSHVRRELFYSTQERQIMVASYADEGGVFRAEKPRLWSQTPYRLRPRGGNQYNYALHPDGDRFALEAESEAESARDRLVFVFNFFDELRRIAPAATR